jgi:Family of unknown function (DUF5687)
MIKHFLWLEWKSFLRSATFKQNLAFKILMGFVVLYFAIIFLSLGIMLYYILEKLKLEPLQTVNKFFIYYVAMDLMVRFFMQKMPTLYIKNLLVLPIPKNKVVHFTLSKTIFSYFNLAHLFFLIPFCVVLFIENYNPIGIIAWFIATYVVLNIVNFVNILINNKDSFFYSISGVFVGLAALQYFKIYDITLFFGPIFQSFYTNWWLFIIPVLLFTIVYYFTFNFYKKDLNLDQKLSVKKVVAQDDSNLQFLNQFGTLGTFLKLDIKLLKRNKRAKTTLYMSIFFLFYGLIFFTQDVYKNGGMIPFAAIFVTGGFLINFGQFVPSWDSSYYQFMMTQNVSYKNYLNSKWWLMVIATIISAILSSFYIYFGWDIYLLVLAGAVYNIGCNSFFILLTGAYNRTAINLESAKGAFGDKKSFNIKTVLFSIPQLLLPIILYYVGKYTYGNYFGIALIALFGILGLLFKKPLFEAIEKIYKKEKYKAIAAYKEVN